MYIETRWPETYIKSKPTSEINWAWVELWEVENPNPNQPGESGENFEGWFKLKKALEDRCWVADCFPQYNVFDWPDEDVALARKLTRRHTCSVCGRNDDPGCTLGC